MRTDKICKVEYHYDNAEQPSLTCYHSNGEVRAILAPHFHPDDLDVMLITTSNGNQWRGLYDTQQSTVLIVLNPVEV